MLAEEEDIELNPFRRTNHISSAPPLDRSNASSRHKQRYRFWNGWLPEFGFERLGNNFILYRSDNFSMILGPDYLGVAFTLLLVSIMTILLNQFILNSHNIEHGFFQVLILSLAVGTICSFLLVALKDPGIITKDRIPLPADEKQLESMPYCDICSIFQPPRVAHCTTCDCCIVGLDHHCPWVGKCIGKGNMFFFKLFNFFWVSYFFLFIWIMAKS